MTRAFTLFELILVMALLVTFAALVLPSFSNSFRGQELDNQATAVLAATEYARSEAISQGAAMTFWANEGQFGVRGGAVPAREKTWTLHRDVKFEELPEESHAVFQPDGTLDLESVGELKLVHSNSNAVVVVKNGNGYRIEK